MVPSCHPTVSDGHVLNNSPTMEVHSRPLTEERPILFRAHFSLLKSLGNQFHRSVIPLSLYGNARSPPPPPPPSPLCPTLWLNLSGYWKLVCLRQKDTWTSPPAQRDHYVTSGFLWFWVHPDEDTLPRMCCLCHGSHRNAGING